jgi:hypothetical protein
MRKLLILLLLPLLVSCTGIQAVAESEATFIACKSADVITTAVGLNSGHFVEANPALKLLIGPHNFVPLITFSIVVWAILHYINEPKLTMAANVVTCGVAGRNAYLLHGAGVMH